MCPAQERQEQCKQTGDERGVRQQQFEKQEHGQNRSGRSSA
ncbi:hypothetical protein BF49_4870 [Bradyrhizobium sp.]|nr:hypothetical protein BF49_4870 [Bradyrhizobium sp.]